MKASAKIRATYAVALALLAAVYSAILFSVKPTLESAHWVAYGFTMLAFILLLADIVT